MPAVVKCPICGSRRIKQPFNKKRWTCRNCGNIIYITTNPNKLYRRYKNEKRSIA